MNILKTTTLAVLLVSSSAALASKCCTTYDSVLKKWVASAVQCSNDRDCNQAQGTTGSKCNNSCANLIDTAKGTVSGGTNTEKQGVKNVKKWNKKHL